MALALLGVSSAQHIPLTFPYGVASGTITSRGISWNTFSCRAQLNKHTKGNGWDGLLDVILQYTFLQEILLATGSS